MSDDEKLTANAPTTPGALPAGSLCELPVPLTALDEASASPACAFDAGSGAPPVRVVPFVLPKPAPIRPRRGFGISDDDDDDEDDGDEGDDEEEEEEEGEDGTGADAGRLVSSFPLASAVQLPTSSPPCVILWRLLCGRRVLELRRVPLVGPDPAVSPDPPPAPVALQLMLPSPALPSPLLAEDPDSRDLTVAVATVSGLVYRIAFPAPLYLHALAVPAAAATAAAASIQCFRVAAVSRAARVRSPAMRPVLAHFPDTFTACFACAGGAIVLVQDQPGDGGRREHQLQEISYVDQLKSYVQTPMKMLSGAFRAGGRSSPAPDAKGRDGHAARVVAFESVERPTGSFLFTLCSDGKLKAYSCSTKQHLRSVNVSSGPTDDSASTTTSDLLNRSISSVIAGVGGLAVSDRSLVSNSAAKQPAAFGHNRLRLFGLSLTDDNG
ncbi:hypothetical protein HK405_015216, partial [Cladochytrium tenue]